VSGADEFYGWSSGELEIIARWHLIRGLGLPAGRDAAWTIEIDPVDGFTCPEQTRHDRALVDEGLRLLRHAYPHKPLSLRRHAMTEHPVRRGGGR
jgi:hypothetical protein